MWSICRYVLYKTWLNSRGGISFCKCTFFISEFLNCTRNHKAEFTADKFSLIFLWDCQYNFWLSCRQLIVQNTQFQFLFSHEYEWISLNSMTMIMFSFVYMAYLNFQISHESSILKWNEKTTKMYSNYSLLIGIISRILK